ncbi:hypothetical protein SAMN04515620_12821 [Collimonas sp. OK607]|nr:hypothetical protein SAMN04515620_12821 [Collimonas sp. OK607]
MNKLCFFAPVADNGGRRVVTKCPRGISNSHCDWQVTRGQKFLPTLRRIAQYRGNLIRRADQIIDPFLLQAIGRRGDRQAGDHLA